MLAQLGFLGARQAQGVGVRAAVGLDRSAAHAGFGLDGRTTQATAVVAHPAKTLLDALLALGVRLQLVGQFDDAVHALLGAVSPGLQIGCRHRAARVIWSRDTHKNLLIVCQIHPRKDCRKRLRDDHESPPVALPGLKFLFL